MSTRGVITEEQLQQMRERNAERARQAVADLGTRWVLHPSRPAPLTICPNCYIVHEGKPL